MFKVAETFERAIWALNAISFGLLNAIAHANFIYVLDLKLLPS